MASEIRNNHRLWLQLRCRLSIMHMVLRLHGGERRAEIGQDPVQNVGCPAWPLSDPATLNPHTGRHLYTSICILFCLHFALCPKCKGRYRRSSTHRPCLACPGLILNGCLHGGCSPLQQGVVTGAMRDDVIHCTDMEHCFHFSTLPISKTFVCSTTSLACGTDFACPSRFPPIHHLFLAFWSAPEISLFRRITSFSSHSRPPAEPRHDSTARAASQRAFVSVAEPALTKPAIESSISNLSITAPVALPSSGPYLMRTAPVCACTKRPNLLSALKEKVHLSAKLPLPRT